ncbi:MAG TPA: SAM-dependent methyltransferase [Lachnospiraceae bacterium]|nr:SAM-dependent methyltransferase [Lachnospiraceae bacterium]
MTKSEKAEKKLNLKYYGGEDLYSDGEIEDKFLDIAKNHTEEELNRVIASEKDWGILYHFSPIRRNIISWFPMKEDAKVLEIGSGCGAITGALCESAKSVTCVDLSKKRSLINAYRNDQYDNFEILVGNFKDIEPNLKEEEYDYITLIGVFEYGEAYIGGDTPYKDFLNIIKKHLKKDGELIIAIENRFGFKYFAGCREDHIGTFFEGLNGYPASDGVKTFDKDELTKLFEECGFDDVDFYYPYPDYKLPMVIYSDDFLPKEGELRKNHVNYDRDRLGLFNDDKVLDDIIRQNMFPAFSNSFLTILRRK